MRKSVLSMILMAGLSLSFTGCVAQSSTATKVQNVATLTQDVLAITGTTSNNASVDKFLNSTSSILKTYQSVNSSLDVLKVANGAITSNGSAISKIAAISELTGLSSKLASLTKQTATATTTGASLIKTLSAQAVSKSTKATEVVENINKVKTCVDALTALGVEMPQTVNSLNTKLTSIKSVTGL